jgi:hypothetical protein
MDATYRGTSRDGVGFHHYDGDRDLLAMNASFGWRKLVTAAGDLVDFSRALWGALFDERWLIEMTTWRDGLRWPPDARAVSPLRPGIASGSF